MKKFLGAIVLCLLGAAHLPAQEDSLAWGEAIVTIEISRLQYNFYQPWASFTGGTRKLGVVISSNEILTTADWLQDSTLVRVQKGGRGPWWNAKIQWIDYHANLATLSVEDPLFWKGLKPAPLAEKVPTKGDVQIWRLSDGNLQSWKGTVGKLFVQKSQRSFVKYMTIDIASDINAAGWAEVVVRNGKMAGLIASQDGNRLMAIPSTLIRFILSARKNNTYTGLGFFDFNWEYSKNPATMEYLRIEGEPRGVIVTGVPELSVLKQVLKPGDVILQIDGFPVDSNGDYKDPDYGYLSFYNLATRGKVAGDEIKLKIWRDGKTMDPVFKLPRADYNVELVPDCNFDRPPEYVIVGGLVLQPLTTSYLQSWGSKWWETGPFRLNYYTFEQPTREQPHILFLSQVLPDEYNHGYQDYAYQVVEKINGKHVITLADALEALKSPQGGFHVLEFARNKEVQRVVLDAGTLEAANARILERYGIPQAHVIHPPDADPPVKPGPSKPSAR